MSKLLLLLFLRTGCFPLCDHFHALDMLLMVHFAYEVVFYWCFVCVRCDRLVPSANNSWRPLDGLLFIAMLVRLRHVRVMSLQCFTLARMAGKCKIFKIEDT